MNQLKLEFTLENNLLPRELDRLIVSFFKASIENESRDLYEKLYAKHSSVMKGYTYSCYLPDAVYESEHIRLGQNHFALFFSDSDIKSTFYFMNAFMKMRWKKYPMNGNSMCLTGISTQPRRTITDSEIIVKMLSPLIARRHDKACNTDTYYTFEQEAFGEVVRENVSMFLQRMNLPMSAETFHIEPVKGKKVVVDTFGGKIDASIGVYCLKGTPDLLNVLYLSGMGARRSEGKGKWELIL